MQWNHPNHLAGFVAELAEAVAIQRPTGWYSKTLYWNASIALRRAAQRVWSKYQRREFAARLGRMLDRPIQFGTFEETSKERQHGGWLPTMQRALVCASSEVLLRRHPLRKEVFTQVDALLDAVKIGGFRDAIEQIELKWRIRDWLALTDVINVNPYVRLAAAAAWEANFGQVAHEIVMAAAKKAVGAGDGTRRY